jgi:UDP-N-acetyl-D-mannosaminuronic acid dehydrogenase
MAEVCVLGLGYVGLPTASLLANAGFKVLGVDLDEHIVTALRSGKCRLEEAGLSTLVSAAVNSGNLVAGTKPEPSGAFIICVPTPVTPQRTVDLRAVENAARAILPHLKKGGLVILESTSPVGTTRNVVGKILSESGLRPGRDFQLCYCPERVLPGNTVNELVNNDRVIGGFSPKCAKRAEELYERFCQGKITLTDDRTAEMCKLMENTSRDVNIALANSFARIAEDAGINAWEAIELASLHPRVKILKPGPGVGGHCIPVDPWFLVEKFPEHAALMRSAREINDTQSTRLLDRMMKTGALKAGDKITILGAAYKADIDDSRESPALLFFKAARRRKLGVAIHDPHVRLGTHHSMLISNDLPACLENATAAVLLTEHKFYRALTPDLFKLKMKGRLIADARNALNHPALRAAGFTVVVLGDGRA